MPSRGAFSIGSRHFVGASQASSRVSYGVWGRSARRVQDDGVGRGGVFASRALARVRSLGEPGFVAVHDVACTHRALSGDAPYPVGLRQVRALHEPSSVHGFVVLERGAEILRRPLRTVRTCVSAFACARRARTAARSRVLRASPRVGRRTARSSPTCRSATTTVGARSTDRVSRRTR